MAFSFLSRGKHKPAAINHQGTPAIRCSICTGEQVAGFRNPETGKFEEVMLLRTPGDLAEFKQRYGLSGDIEKFY